MGRHPKSQVEDSFTSPPPVVGHKMWLRNWKDQRNSVAWASRSERVVMSQQKTSASYMGKGVAGKRGSGDLGGGGLQSDPFEGNLQRVDDKGLRVRSFAKTAPSRVP